MKITIVGANSYIARNLLYVLKQGGPDLEVKLYDRAEAHADGAEGYTKVDILDRGSVSGIDMDCDALYMFAGKTGTAAGFDDYGTFINVNEIGLLNILDEYRARGSGAKIIFPSTRLVYKGGDGPLKEDAPKEFRTIYAINKYACEQYLEQYSRVYGIRYCILRICIPYGTLVPGASSYGTIGFMLERASRGENIMLYGDGSARRTFTHIGDVCDSLIRAACSDRCVNDVFNVGGEDLSLKEVAELVAAKYGVGIDYAAYPEMALKLESGDTVFDAAKLAGGDMSAGRRLMDWITEGDTHMDKMRTDMNSRKSARGGVIRRPDMTAALRIAPARLAA